MQVKLVIGSAGSGSQIPGSRIRKPDPDPWIRPFDLYAFWASETALNGFICNEFFHLWTLFLLLSIGGLITEHEYLAIIETQHFPILLHYIFDDKVFGNRLCFCIVNKMTSRAVQITYTLMGKKQC